MGQVLKKRTLFLMAAAAAAAMGAFGHGRAEASSTTPPQLRSAAGTSASWVGVMIELKDLPATQIHARALARVLILGDAPATPEQPEPRAREAVAAARAQLSHLEAAQQGLLTRLLAPEFAARPLFRLTRVYNGIAVEVEPQKVARLQQLPGVVAVHPLVSKVPANSTSVAWVGAPAVWDSLGLGLLGQGIKIGIVDTGVDYLHTDFGGSGLAADYAANDPTHLADGFFPTAKVVGGFDFVGDAYDALSANPAQRIPQPDPDPMDCDGHGTHVAGTAAGFGVQADGTTFPGPYGPSTPLTSLRIGPGVAPAAALYALRVFGCSGSTAVVEQAIEWAVDPDGNGDFSDHLDVLNLSLTSPFASATDSTAVAADNAALVGVIVVAAAGNDGGTHFITGSPAVASRALSTAVMWDAELLGAGVRVTSPAAIAGTHQAGGALFGPSLPLSGGISGEAVLADPPAACTPLTNAAAVAGKIALLDRNPGCSAVTQVRQAQLAGAIAAVVINPLPGLAALPNDGTGGSITITSLQIRTAAGATIKSALPGVQLTLARVLLGDMFASFSSRGPRRAASPVALKPDLAAPGVAITSAQLGNSTSGGQRASVKSGTSMASPHVAGMMALLRQLHPSWTVAQLKALAMGTTVPVYYDPEHTPPVLGPAHMGSGRMDLSRAAQAGVIAYAAAAPELVGVSFGQLAVLDELQAVQTVELRNLTSTDAVYDLTLDTVSDIPGLGFSLGSSSVTVPALGTAQVSVQLTADAALMQHSRDPTLDAQTLGFDRHWLSEEQAFLLLTPTAATALTGETVSLRLPIYAAARPAASMAATSALLDLGPGLTGAASVQLEGHAVATGLAPPLDEISLVTPFSLQQVMTAEPAPDRNQLAAVGVTTDVAAQPGGLAASQIFFAIASWGDGSTPHTVRQEVAIDTDRDGDADFLLRNTDQGSFVFDFKTDALASELIDLASNIASLQGPLNFFSPAALHTVPFGTNLMILPVRAADLGLSPGNSRFNYQVSSSDAVQGGTISTLGMTALGDVARELVDPGWPGSNQRFSRPLSGELPAPQTAQSAVLSFDPAAPGLDFTGGITGLPTREDQNGASLPIAFDLTAHAANSGLGILLLHHHNRTGARWEAIGLRSGALPDLVASLTASPDPAIAGGVLTYTATVSNLGGASASSIVLTDPLPAEVTYLPALSDPNCSELSGVVTCQFGNLDPLQQRSRKFRVQIAANLALGATLTNQVSVTSATFDPHPFNNSAQVTSLIGNLLFADGFESGTTSAWSSRQPAL